MSPVVPHGPCVCVQSAKGRVCNTRNEKPLIARQRHVCVLTHRLSITLTNLKPFCSSTRLVPLLSNNKQQWYYSSTTLRGGVCG